MKEKENGLIKGYYLNLKKILSGRAGGGRKFYHRLMRLSAMDNYGFFTV
jgi:hypothetical protein